MLHHSATQLSRGSHILRSIARKSYVPKSLAIISKKRRYHSFADLIEQVESGSISASEAKKIFEIQNQNTTKEPSEVLESFANLDHARADRCGFPEAIFSSGKTAKQIATILDDMAGHVNKIANEQKSLSISQKAILATRVDESLYKDISKIPLKNGTIIYHEMAKIISMEASAFTRADPPTIQDSKPGKIVVSCAGTTDLPISEEAAITLEAAGCDVERIYDVGVAGLHRIINALPRLQNEDVKAVIVVAGMDGALPSVVAGLVDVPVIAVPTSIGYGASFGGVSAMLTMLNSCAPGVGVVNIDNGFGGAALAFKCIK